MPHLSVQQKVSTLDRHGMQLSDISMSKCYGCLVTSAAGVRVHSDGMATGCPFDILCDTHQLEAMPGRKPDFAGLEAEVAVLKGHA